MFEKSHGSIHAWSSRPEMKHAFEPILSINISFWFRKTDDKADEKT